MKYKARNEKTPTGMSISREGLFRERNAVVRSKWKSLGQELGEPVKNSSFRLLHHPNRRRLLSIARTEHTKTVGDRPGGVTDFGVLTELESGNAGGEVQCIAGEFLDTDGSGATACEDDPSWEESVLFELLKM